MPTIMIVLSVLLVLSFARSRLLATSVKESNVGPPPQIHQEYISKAMRKRQTFRKKKQARPNATPKHIAASMLCCASSKEAALRKSTDEETEAEVGETDVSTDAK